MLRRFKATSLNVEHIADSPSRFATEFIQAGERFTLGNIDIRLQRTCLLPQSSSPAEVAPRTPNDLRLLDDSTSYVLQASLTVGEDGKPEVMTGAFDEMARLKDLLKSLVDLQLGDRLTMNTRVR